MTFNTDTLTAAIETAKAKAAGNKALLNAIEKASLGLRGAWIVTELSHSLCVTTESGETYFANGTCQCKAFVNGMICKHRVAYRIVAIYNEMEAAEKAARRGADIKVLATNSDKPATRITRSIERDFKGNRYAVVRCDGWAI